MDASYNVKIHVVITVITMMMAVGKRKVIKTIVITIRCMSFVLV